MIDFDNKTLQEIATKSIPAAYRLLPAGMDSRKATVILLAIGLQESRFIHRLQIGGPARGFWQFERGGGVRGVLRHWATRAATIKVCAARQCALLPNAVYLQIAEDDVLAAAFARLLLYSDPAELPHSGTPRAPGRFTSVLGGRENRTSKRGRRYTLQRFNRSKEQRYEG